MLPVCYPGISFASFRAQDHTARAHPLPLDNGQGAAASTPAGHGRSGAAAYRGARRVSLPHTSLKAGDSCPAGCGGKVYPLRDPGVLVRLHGQAPIAATVYELEKLRCNLCNDIFTAAAPAEAGEKKYDESAASTISLFLYGSGFPWNRLAHLEESFGIPLPAPLQKGTPKRGVEKNPTRT